MVQIFAASEENASDVLLKELRKNSLSPLKMTLIRAVSYFDRWSRLTAAMQMSSRKSFSAAGHEGTITQTDKQNPH